MKTNHNIAILAVAILTTSLHSLAMEFSEGEYAKYCRYHNKKHGAIACLSACMGIGCCCASLSMQSATCPCVGVTCPCIGMLFCGIAKYYYNQRFTPCKSVAQAACSLSCSEQPNGAYLLSDEELLEQERQLQAAEHLFEYRAQCQNGNSTDSANAEQCLRLRCERTGIRSLRAAIERGYYD